MSQPRSSRASRLAARGMTLLEVMVAVAVLAGISVLIHGVMTSLSAGKKGEGLRAERVHQGREAMQRIVRDLSCAYLSMHVPPTLALQTERTAFVGRSSTPYDRLDFTAFAHLRTERDAHESDQAEVGYFVVRDPEVDDKMDLVRREQTPIDYEPLKGGIVNVVAENVQEFHVRYLDPLTSQWVLTWDSQQVTGQPNRLPLEVEITIVLKPVGNGQPYSYTTKIFLPLQQPLAFGIQHVKPARPTLAAARARRRKRERGVALIMVLGAIAIMVVMLAEFQDDAGAEFAAATAARDSVQAEYFAKSAIALERLLIASEPTMRQAITPLFMLMKQTPPQLPVWEYSDRILGAFNDQDGSKDFSSLSGLDLSLSKNVGLKGGHFEVTVVDEDAKINVNMGGTNQIAHIRLAKELMSAMAPIQYDPLFTQRDSTGNYNDRLTTCSAIIDWADPDEQLFSCDTSNGPSSNAVEDSWYQLLAKPYRRKNAPYDSLEELHMARGVSDDYWATFVDPEPTDPRKRIMTVWGQGTVNVNSANAMTLYGLVCAGAPTAEMCTDPLQMQLFIMGMTMAKGITMGAPIFGSPKDFISAMEGKGMLGPMLTLLGLKPVKFQSESDFAKSLSTQSKVFSIYAVGAVKGFRRETRVKIHTVVDFRGIDPLVAGGPTTAASNTTSATAPPGGSQVTTPGATSSSITSALQPNVGGNVLYYEIE